MSIHKAISPLCSASNLLRLLLNFPDFLSQLRVSLEFLIFWKKAQNGSVIPTLKPIFGMGDCLAVPPPNLLYSSA